jgi:hypothetical protein
MDTLGCLSNLYKCDKSSRHCYIDLVYSKEFEKVRHDQISLLEIGVYNGASIRMWRDYFTNAELYGIDISIKSQSIPCHLIQADAYSDDIINILDGYRFDYIIEDGSHNLEDQLYVCNTYIQWLKVGGKLIIEDIQSLGNAIDILISLANTGDVICELLDYRHAKKRYDDILIIVSKIK